ncbi:MAG: cytochrome C biogenesis protein [Puniceicoccaceae bacterium MED-G31]|nr:MAG: cytochrome C biogenesis protein [Puniceicoccaceae bacterium MED-G31]
MLESISLTDRDAFLLSAYIFLAAFLYGSLTLGWRRHYSHKTVFCLITSGFIIQTIGLNLRAISVNGCPLGNFFEITQFISWSTVLLYFIVGPVFRIRLLSLFCAGLTTFLSGTSLLLPALDKSYPISEHGPSAWIELHASLAVFSYAFFAMVTLLSVMFLIQQHGLKKKQGGSIYNTLAPIQKLDQISHRLLLTGVICLTAALACGAIFYTKNSQSVPVFKLIVTCLVWIGYCGVIVLRNQRKLVTRRHAIAVIALFIFALLSLWPVQSARLQPHDLAEEPLKNE